MTGWTKKMPLGTEVGFGPCDVVLDGNQLPLKGAQRPNFRPMSLVAKWLSGSDATWYEGRPRPMPYCVRRGPSSPAPIGAQQPPITVHLYCGHGRPSQLLLSSC